jgi:hypothetical protein
VTPADIILDVRDLVQDTATPYRYSDAVLLRFVNQAFRRAAVIRPDLFHVYEEALPTIPGKVQQSLPEGSIRLVEIFAADGRAILEVARETLDQSHPEWRSDDPGQPLNFMRHPRNPTMFFLWPPPSLGVTLEAEYARTPALLGINDEIEEFPAAYIPAIIDCTVGLAESVDDEHVNSGRAKQFMDSFTQQMGLGLQVRPVSDSEGAGMSPEAQPR